MKKWSLIVAALYGLILVTLFVPVAAFALIKNGALNLKYPAYALGSWVFWLTIAVLVLAQFALLRVPVALAHRRPVKQRSVWSTVLAAAFMMGLLVFGFGLSLCELIAHGMESRDCETYFWVSLGFALTSWALWTVYFYQATKTAAPADPMARLQRRLWTGSILELLVAVPTHIVARQRTDCCAGYMSFIGLTCGISVMLFAFGPAVYFLFVERWKRLHPKA